MVAHKSLSDSDISRIIEMAWEDRTPLDAIEKLYGLNEPALRQLMRRELRPSSFRLWRQRVSGRVTKHQALRPAGIERAYCPTQYKHK
ncbi:TIGR03643 family protein [Bacterioplanes sanyensis]|uniref:TIGR03643 family protein n=1 Tax=Bacterioplanes sanyensis TaxID=1249553 RepID=UPI0016737E80|nr:TIGR03643 family protein [Bacterioplanes sanyensis]GGY34181.1 TIGR03643 family protein [Bacterioplanes sanyensis]